MYKAAIKKKMPPRTSTKAVINSARSRDRNSSRFFAYKFAFVVELFSFRLSEIYKKESKLVYLIY